ncbi:MAG: diaminopimelate decarboxylase [Anaerolineae bacterium]|nr:diaminopimelate decarboxylase [Anaerolineae bacterium]
MDESLRLFPSTAQVDAHGRLWLGGCLARDLAEQFGTPLYVYDAEMLLARCAEARSALERYPGRRRLAYASKAYLCLGLAQLFAHQGLDLDVTSAGEIAVAQAAGYPPERVHLHGNNKSERELAMALDWGIGTIVVDGFHELEMLGRLTAGRASPQKVWLRVAPGIDVHTHPHRKTGLLDSKFGFTLETGEAAAALRLAQGMAGLKVVGLHAHLGSQVFEPEPFARAAASLLDLAADERFIPLELSPGGGWGVATGPGEADLPLASFAEAIASAAVERCARHRLPLPTLVVELGRAIVAPAGVALYRVGARKEVPGVRTYLALDGGMGDNVRPALYGARYAALAAEAAASPPEEVVTLAGRFCESGDVIARDVPLPRLRPGDLVAVPRAGAYCLAMASNYNLVPRPAVVLVRGGKACLLQRRETAADLLARDLPLDTSWHQ